MNGDEMFSEPIELATVGVYDPTYGGTSDVGLFLAHTCRACGALIDAAASATHRTFHEGAN